jgi:hypothetical protein
LGVRSFPSPPTAQAIISRKTVISGDREILFTVVLRKRQVDNPPSSWQQETGPITAVPEIAQAFVHFTALIPRVLCAPNRALVL